MIDDLGRKLSITCLVSLFALSVAMVPTSSAQGQYPNQSANQPNLHQAPQGQGEAADDLADPPSRVARVSFLDGSVSMQPGGVGDWGAASLNRPVTIGDKLWTDQNARLELQAGQASIHLGGMTALSFLNLDENAIQMRLAEGRINFRVREMRQGDVDEVDTPNAAFTVTVAGAFRLDVNEDGDRTNVTVIRGEGQVVAGGQIYTVHAGERATIAGLDNAVQYDVKAAPLTPDELDLWAEQRDLREENSVSAEHVSREVVGYSDLDDYGTWKEEPTYGSVWYPNAVAPGWAPYSYGYWNWVGPWGWTWIDSSPWGFAPYHYGRWIYGGGRWGWCPGPIYARPYYGPAYVGFLGGGFGVGFGWFPLGWGEPYRPWYHCGRGYWNNVNVHNTYIRNVNSIHNGSTNYAYAHNPHAVTVASRSAFTSGQAINRSSQHLTEASLRGATVTNNINATPTRASYFGAAHTHGHVSTPSSNVENRAVVARNTPATGASHLPVHTMNSSALRTNNPGNRTTLPSYNRTAPSLNSAAALNRQQQSASNRPPSARPQGAYNTSNPNTRYGSSPARTWNAQGNVTDSGRAPQGFGSNSNRPYPTNEVRTTTNRPPYAGTMNRNVNLNRPPSTYRPPSSYNGGNNRSYSQPRANTSMPSRTYSPPPPRAAYGNAPPSGGGGGHPSGGGGYPNGGGGHPSGGGGHPSGGGGSHPHR